MIVFTWRICKEEEWENHIFETLEECLEEVHNMSIKGIIEVGELEEERIQIDGRVFLEDFIEPYCYDMNRDLSDFLDLKSKVQIKDLENKLVAAFYSWMEEHNSSVPIYEVVKVTKVNIE